MYKRKGLFLQAFFSIFTKINIMKDNKNKYNWGFAALLFFWLIYIYYIFLLIFSKNPEDKKVLLKHSKVWGIILLIIFFAKLNEHLTNINN